MFLAALGVVGIFLSSVVAIDCGVNDRTPPQCVEHAKTWKVDYKYPTE